MMKRLAACVLLLLGASAANAQVVLNLDFTGPNTIVITSTGVSPVTSDAAHTFFDGIDLEGLFQPNGSGALTVVSGNLTTGDASGGPVYNSAFADSLSEPHADLNLYIGSSSTIQSFTFGQSAFTFSTSLTVTFGPGLVFSGIDYGVVSAGYSGSDRCDAATNFADAAVSTTPNTVAIGVYHVTGHAVPEPSTYAMLLCGALFLGVVARRRLA